MTLDGRTRVRTATRDDAPALLPLFEAFYGAHFEPKTAAAIREHLSAASAFDTVLVAELGGVAVGFASLRLLPQVENDVPFAELADLFVEARVRRQGIGRALVAHAERLARERDCPRMSLVTAPDNDEARAFYRALGFEDHAVQLQKSLEVPR